MHIFTDHETVRVFVTTYCRGIVRVQLNPSGILVKTVNILVCPYHPPTDKNGKGSPLRCKRDEGRVSSRVSPSGEKKGEFFLLKTEQRSIRVLRDLCSILGFSPFC